MRLPRHQSCRSSGRCLMWFRFDDHTRFAAAHLRALRGEHGVFAEDGTFKPRSPVADASRTDAPPRRLGVYNVE